jgi:hypothetical protein
LGETENSVRRRFLGSSSDEPVLVFTHQYWCVGAKHNGSQPLYVL